MTHSALAGDCRAVAARCIAAVVAGQSLTPALGAAESMVATRDRALLRELSYGSLRWWPQLQPLCDGLLARPLKPRDADLRALLIVGAYQLLHMGLPAHAAVDSAVSATRALGKPWARGLINGVLRRLQREHTRLLAALPEPARHAHPEWLWHALVEAWGIDHTLSLCAANNSRPPMTLRVNRRHGERDQYRQRLAAAGIGSTLCTTAPDGLQLGQPVAIERLPGFAEGAVSVQDEAAQRVASLLPLKPGMRVLDACAAPGGKTAHLLEREPGLALTAVDIDAERLQRVAETLERLQLKASLVAGNAEHPSSWWDGHLYDAILVDAPCSGSGVIRRHPDIKLLRKRSDVPLMAQRQLKMLQALWPLLRPGGTLLYTTCSVLPEENYLVAQQWSDWAGAEAIHWPILDGDHSVDVASTAGGGGGGLVQPVGYQQLTQANGPDGFFYARWRRQS